MTQKCEHRKVSRNNDTWTCDTCGAKFYHLEDLGFPGKIAVMPEITTLRDQFAMAALPQVLQIPVWIKKDIKEGLKGVAEICYALADLMLQQRKKELEDR